MTMHNTSNTVQISDWRSAVLVSPAETKVANSEIPTSTSAGTYQKVPRISMVSLRARRVRRRDSGWLRIRVGNRAAETQDEQPRGQRRQHIGHRRRSVRQMHAKAFNQARVVQGFTKRGETADQP